MPRIEIGTDRLAVLRAGESLSDAISRLRGDRWGVAVVLDDDDRFVSTVTDYGIRHAILDRLAPEASVSEFMSARPVVAAPSSSEQEVAELIETHRVTAVPVVDELGAVVGMRSVDDLAAAPVAPAAVIMAGGRGLRLRPVTDKTPKPLLRIGSRSIVERIIAGLIDAGVRDVYLAVN